MLNDLDETYYPLNSSIYLFANQMTKIYTELDGRLTQCRQKRDRRDQIQDMTQTGVVNGKDQNKRKTVDSGCRTFPQARFYHADDYFKRVIFWAKVRLASSFTILC